MSLNNNILTLNILKKLTLLSSESDDSLRSGLIRRIQSFSGIHIDALLEMELLNPPLTDYSNFKILNLSSNRSTSDLTWPKVNEIIQRFTHLQHLTLPFYVRPHVTEIDLRTLSATIQTVVFPNFQRFDDVSIRLPERPLNLKICYPIQINSITPRADLNLTIAYPAIGFRLPDGWNIPVSLDLTQFDDTDVEDLSLRQLQEFLDRFRVIIKLDLPEIETRALVQKSRISIISSTLN